MMRSVSSVVVNSNVLTALLCGLVLYFICMDMLFYTEIQNSRPLRLKTESQTQYFNASKPHTPTDTYGVSRQKLTAAAEQRTTRVSTRNLHDAPEKIQETESSYSLFHPLTVKLMMLPQKAQYVDEPLSYLIVQYTKIAALISPNMASLLGVLVAAFSCKLLMSNKLGHRQLGVLLFMVRDLIDGLDGNIGRERSLSHNKGYAQVPNNMGFFVDCVADGCGDIFRFIALVQRVHSVHGTPSSPIGQNGTKSPPWSQFLFHYRYSIQVVAWLLVQTFMSGTLWNYFLIEYHQVLETNPLLAKDLNTAPGITVAQDTLLRSLSMWMICYGWRLINPGPMALVQLIATLYNLEVELVLAIHKVGFILPTIMGVFSFLHLQYCSSTVLAAAIMSL